MKRKAFTLIELLVVISIIALLVSILMPALGKARDQARRTVCSSNMRSNVLALRLYSDQNNDRLPLQSPAGYWPWDVSYWTTDIILKSGSDPEIFYCPSNKTMSYENDHNWRFSELDGTPQVTITTPEPSGIETRKNLYRVTTYFWMMENTNVFTADPSRNEDPGKMQIDTIFPKREWIYNLSKVKNPVEVELVADCCMRVNETKNYTEIPGGTLTNWGIYDTSNHVKNGTDLAGGGAAYVDGHYQWRNKEELTDITVSKTWDIEDRMRTRFQAYGDSGTLLDFIW